MGPVQVTLVSPFPTAFWPQVWAWSKPFGSSVFDDFAPRTVGDFVAWMTARASVPGFRSFAVRHRDEYGGVITFEQSHPDAPSA